MKNDLRAYSICEPPIYEALDWNMNQIMSCLELLRYKLPSLLNVNIEHLEFDLVSLENPLGPPYPVIGIYASEEFDGSLPDFIELNDIANLWVQSVGIKTLKKKAINLKTVSWEELRAAGHITFTP